MVGIDQSLVVWLDHCSSPMHHSTFHHRFFSSTIHRIISSSFHYEIQKFSLEKKEKGNRKAVQKLCGCDGRVN
ncbi:hypothetical protein NC651_036401 [Populus alba x Populus x berolinensis]|nr:hypothetical protein NC651_036401 [Populus alba x Populus x berolinensis]